MILNDGTGLDREDGRIENEMASASRTVIDMSKVEEERVSSFFFSTRNVKVSAS